MKGWRTRAMGNDPRHEMVAELGPTFMKFSRLLRRVKKTRASR
jgi:hypothetical protein